MISVRRMVKHFPIHKGLLGRRSGVVRAVEDVSFELTTNQTLALVGESGCGKTTTGRAMLRLVEPDSGEVLYRGQNLLTLPPEALRPLRRRLQIIFQDPYASLNPRHSVERILTGPMILHGVCTRAEARTRAAALLNEVGLEANLLSRYPHEFSGGQRQRIGIARALSVEPDLIVCDEAVSALDVSVRAQVLNLLAELQERRHLAYLFISHDLSVVRHLADIVAVMYLGRIVEQAPRDALFSQPYHPYTQALLSAVPEPRPGLARRRIRLTGEIPSPSSPPTGCRFHTRCPLRHGRCVQETPATYTVGPGHEVACHLYEASTERQVL